MDKIKKSSENDQLTGLFRVIFIFGAFIIIFFISPEQTVKLVK